MKKNRFKIKEFSLLCQVTVKTLRHYEKIGLLKPNEVDAWTGYRYYDVAQMQTLLNIRRLKSMGFSLDEILELYADGKKVSAYCVESIKNQYGWVYLHQTHALSCCTLKMVIG